MKEKRPYVDFSGKTFGRWIVLGPECGADAAEGRFDGAPSGYSGRWHVQCECGAKKVRPIAPLLEGRSRGCLRCMRRREHRKFWQDYTVRKERREALDSGRLELPLDSRRGRALPRRASAERVVLVPDKEDLAEQVRFGLITELRGWIIEQNKSQESIAAVLKIPRSAVSTIMSRTTRYEIGRLLALYKKTGGHCELKLTRPSDQTLKVQ